MNKVNNIGTLKDLLQCIIFASEDMIKNGGTQRTDLLKYILEVSKNEENSQEFLFNVLTFFYCEVKKNIKMTTAAKLDLLGDLNEIALKECGRNFTKLQHDFAWLNK